MIATGEEKNIPEDINYRKLSASIMISKKENFLGGDFEIFCLDDGPDKALHKISIDRGSMIMFPSFVMHRITEIFAGTRRALIYRFSGPKWE